MPCVFTTEEAAADNLPGRGTPIMAFRDEISWQTARERVLEKFNYEKISVHDARRFADSLGFK